MLKAMSISKERSGVVQNVPWRERWGSLPIRKWIITGKDPRIGLATEQPDKLRNSENPFKDFLFLVCKGSGDRSHTPPQVKSTNSQGWLAGMHYQVYGMQNHLGDRPLWGSKFLIYFHMVNRGGKTHCKGEALTPWACVLDCIRRKGPGRQNSCLSASWRQLQYDIMLLPS